MNTLAILLAYQATWFVAVIGAGRGSWWPGVLAAALFALWRLAVSPARALELRLLLAALGIGLLLESVWVGSGLLDYAAWPWAGPPAWILALWCAFALVVVPLLGYLHRRLWLAAAAWVQGLAELFFTLYADVTDIFNLLCIPPDVRGESSDAAVWEEAAKFCHDRRAFLIVDPPALWDEQRERVGL